MGKTGITKKGIYSVTAREKQNLAVPPERNTPSVPSITERSGCNPKPPTADTEAMLNTVAATFSKILPKLKKPIKPIKPTKYNIEKIALLIQKCRTSNGRNGDGITFEKSQLKAKLTVCQTTPLKPSHRGRLLEPMPEALVNSLSVVRRQNADCPSVVCQSFVHAIRLVHVLVCVVTEYSSPAF